MVEDTVTRPSDVAGHGAQAAVEMSMQLVDVAVEQHRALLQLDAGIIEQRIEPDS